MNLAAALALPFPALAARAVALALADPGAVRAALERLDPFEGRRLFLELARVARGELPPRRMSRDLRAALPYLTAGAGAARAWAAQPP